MGGPGSVATNKGQGLVHGQASMADTASNYMTSKTFRGATEPCMLKHDSITSGLAGQVRLDCCCQAGR